MKRLSAVVLERDQRAVLRALGRMGVLHLIRTQPGPETAPLPPADRSAALGRCDELLARIDNLCRRLEIQLPAEGAAEPPEMSLDRIDAALRPVERQVNELLHDEQQLRQRLGQAAAVQRQVMPFESLDVPVDMLGGSTFLHFAIGSLPAEGLEAVKGRVGPNVLLLPLPETEEGLRPVVAITSSRAKDALESTLQEAGFERATFCGGEGATPATLARDSRHERQRVESLLAEAREGIAAFRPEAAAALGELRRAIVTERCILGAQQEFPRTEQTILVRGWAPARAVSDARKTLQEATGGRFVLTTQDPRELPDEEVPVLLSHLWILRPFEMIVSGYGLPRYTELEPTLFVAVSYVVMFGMMFGDAGHGAVVALGGLAAILAGKSAKVRDVGVLLALAGLSSVVFGLLYGECFGFNEAHGWPLPAFWGDPLASSGALMATSIGIGIGLMSLGLVLNMINKFRRGDVIGGLLDKFGVAGAVFYWGVLALAAKYTAVTEMGLFWAALVAVVVVPLAAIAMKEPLELVLARSPVRRHKKHGHEAVGGSMFEAVLMSLVEAFEAVIAYIGNTVSFVRIGAYGISHAAIMMATFVVAAQVGSWVKGPASSVIWAVVVVSGNIMAILLEGLVAFVQAVRLEWYEFFGKFFSGSGRAFEPFRISAGGQGFSA